MAKDRINDWPTADDTSLASHNLDLNDGVVEIYFMPASLLLGGYLIAIFSVLYTRANSIIFLDLPTGNPYVLDLPIDVLPVKNTDLRSSARLVQRRCLCM